MSVTYYHRPIWFITEIYKISTYTHKHARMYHKPPSYALKTKSSNSWVKICFMDKPELRQ